MIVLIAFFMAMPSIVHSQDVESYEPEVIPPNPTAYQLLTQGNIPSLSVVCQR